MKTLLLMRHAKSDWDAEYHGDHERPLNRRGVRSARLMGRLLASRDLVPDLAISSTAARAATTIRMAAESGEWDTAISYDDRLYGSGPDVVLQVAASAPEVSRLMLVGHQPTWSMLVRQITGQYADMKTATVAQIEMDSARSGTLTAVINPREYFDSEWDSDA